MIGVILAGGASSRFGGEPKGLKMLRGLPLVGHVHANLSMVCTEVVIECVPGSGYEGWGVECISARPEHAGKGPLAGLLAGLERASGGESVVFAPCDMPLVAPPLFERLARETGGGWAVSPLGDEPLVCALPVRLREAVAEGLDQSPIPRVVHVLASAGAAGVRFADEWPFVNVNTPEDLDRLEASF
jgi:molybdopterin-guanine dinucleotide biosynthesis protein A